MHAAVMDSLFLQVLRCLVGEMETGKDELLVGTAGYDGTMVGRVLDLRV